MNRIFSILIFLLVAIIGFTQEYQPYQAPYSQPQKKTKKAKITIQAFDGINYRGDLVTIGYDYLLIDAKKYNSPAKLRPYYVRPQDEYYRFDIEYIKSATMSRGRSVGVSTFRGTILGVLFAGLVSWSALKGDIWFDSFGEWAVTSGVIIGIGTSAGFITGLIRRKKVIIDGNPYQLNKLRDFYNP
jgi:hypothetical protein